MSTVSESIREVATLVEIEPREVLALAPLRAVMRIIGTPTVTPSNTVREVAQLDDYADPHVFTLVREVALLDDNVVGSAQLRRLAHEKAEISDRAFGRARVQAVVREIAQLNDAARDNTLIQSLREVAYLSDRASVGARASLSVREVARLDDRIATFVGARVREVLLVTSRARVKLDAYEKLREVAVLDDAVVGHVNPRETVREVAILDDAVLLRTIHQVAVRDVAYLYDEAIPKPGGRAYTCSISTWGMSFFDNFPFKSIAGNYAAGANLWRLDAPDDYGTPIQSSITLGVMDMGVSSMKRLSTVHLAGISSQPLTVTVSGDIRGARQTYAYPCQMRDQTNYRNNRAIIGKGFRSRYLQIKIGSDAGAQYKLLNAEADIAVGARRIG